MPCNVGACSGHLQVTCSEHLPFIANLTTVTATCSVLDFVVVEVRFSIH